MKKLLINRNKLLLLTALFIVYVFMGWVITRTVEIIEDDRLLILTEHTGKFNPQLYEESKEIYKAAVDKYGSDEALAIQVNHDPVLWFHAFYNWFGTRVNRYWNGPENQDSGDILYPLQEKLKALENVNQAGSYEYRFYQKRLNTELAHGEPYLANVRFWVLYFKAFDATFVILLFMMALAFFIFLLFTQEVKTEMDSIILCSEKGRREIAATKLLSAGITSAIIAAVYLLGHFIGIGIGCGDLSGFDTPIRSLSGFENAMLNVRAGEMALISSFWLIFVALIFSLALALISALSKYQSAVFGLGFVILMSGGMLNYLGGNAREILWPLIDFNFSNMAMFNSIFGGKKIFKILGTPVSYGAAAFILYVLLGALACLLVFVAQKKRMVSQ
ncbi:MAG: hypothetical protein LBJ41_07580 [Treponema sp.]|jgi:hypothetical protein|nr:hypothetical protein [Treponema sp.]